MLYIPISSGSCTQGITDYALALKQNSYPIRSTVHRVDQQIIRANHLTENHTADINSRYVPNFDRQTQRRLHTLTATNPLPPAINTELVNCRKRILYPLNSVGRIPRGCDPTRKKAEFKMGAGMSSRTFPPKLYYNG